MAREWTSATYRRNSLQNIAAHLVAFKPNVAEYLAIVINQWELPKHEKSALEVRMLQASLDYNNYKVAPDGAEGRKHFIYPEKLQSEIARYQNATEPSLRLLTLPSECKQLLGQPEELSTEKAEDLAGFLNADLSVINTDVNEEDEQLARIAAASTLITHARHWLKRHPEIYDKARSIVHSVIDQIGDDSELLRVHIIGNKSGTRVCCPRSHARIYLLPNINTCWACCATRTDQW